MKTVMKKLLSLMMVAVLLVSAVPAAFAAEGDTLPCPLCGETATLVTKNAVPATCTTVQRDIYHCPNDSCAYKDNFYNDIAGSELGHNWKDATCNDPKTCETCGATEGAKLGHDWEAATCTAPQTCKRCGGSTGTAAAHDWNAATCTAPKTCKTCGATEGDPASHTAGAAATCTEAQKCTVCKATLADALGHSYGSDGKCSRCGIAETSTHEVYFSVNGNQNYWHLGVKHGMTVANPGFTYGTDYHYLDKVTDTDTHKFMGWSKNPSDTNGSALEYIVAMPVKESVTYYAIFQAKQTTTPSTPTTTSTPSIPSGDHSLHVCANVWVGDVLHDTVLIDSIGNLSASAKIYDVISQNKSYLESQFPSGYYGIEWTETVYFKVNSEKSSPVTTAMTVGDENHVFINLYSGEKLVVVNVHTSKSYSVDMNVRIKGFRVGDIVTYDDVLKAVQKHYNVSSMDLYTYNNMQNVIEGKPAVKTLNFVVEEGDNVYEVLINGSRKSGSTTYTADSTNPKTGDAIYTPVIVMGASVSALAVLFFLNKKRTVI